jgi:hypothetical protein
MYIPFVRATLIAHEVPTVSYNHFARQRYRIHRIPAQHQRRSRCVCFADVRLIVGHMSRSADRTVQIQDTQYDGCQPPDEIAMPDIIDFGSLQLKFLQTMQDTAGSLDMFQITAAQRAHADSALP